MKLAVLGDSLSEGVVSAPWVRYLQALAEGEAEELPNAPRIANLHVSNFSTGGDLAYNGMLRLTDVLAYEPDACIVFLGANDASAFLSESWMLWYVERKCGPSRPSEEFFVKSMRRIVSTLRQKCVTFVCTIPPQGENLTLPINARIRRYNTHIRTLCEEYGAEIIDVYSLLAAHIPANYHAPHFNPDGPHYHRSCAWHEAGISFDEIARRHGLVITSDFCHLTETSARAVAHLVAQHLPSAATRAEHRREDRC